MIISWGDLDSILSISYFDILTSVSCLLLSYLWALKRNSYETGEWLQNNQKKLFNRIYKIRDLVSKEKTRLKIWILGLSTLERKIICSDRKIQNFFKKENIRKGDWNIKENLREPTTEFQKQRKNYRQWRMI